MTKRPISRCAAAVSIALLAAPSHAAITWDLRPTGLGHWDWELRGNFEQYETSNTEPQLLIGYYNIYTQWQTGYCVELVIQNQGTQAVHDWAATISLNGSVIYDIWNLETTANSGVVTVSPQATWSRVIEAGENTHSLGFCANRPNGSGILPSFPSVTDNSSLPFVTIYGFMWHNAAGHCIEVETAPGRFSVNPDTRIWVKGWEGGTWQALNDDFGGTLQSKARLWIEFPGSFEGQYYAKVAPRDASGSVGDFELITRRLDLSREQCTTGQSAIPWAAFIGDGTQQTPIIVSPNAT